MLLQEISTDAADEPPLSSDEQYPYKREFNSNSILSAAFGPFRISPITSPPGKSVSNIGSPGPFIFESTACRKCHLNRLSRTLLISFRSLQIGSSCLPCHPSRSSLKQKIL